MNFARSLSIFVYALLEAVVEPLRAIRRKALKLASILNALKSQVLARAYYVWSQKGILAANGWSHSRSGTTMIDVGIELIVAIIFLTVATYFAAFSLPGALTAIATTALTSVNAGVVVIFQTLVSLVVVFTLILLYVGVVRWAMRSVR